MAPAARHEETKPVFAPSSESDMAGAQGSGRKYAGAMAVLALVVVIVGGVGMHRQSVQATGRDAEIGDIIEACADYTVQASCSAASCNWNSARVQCEELAGQKQKTFLSTKSEPYVAAAEREDQDNSTVNVESANGVITATLAADVPAGATVLTFTDATGLEIGMYIVIDGQSYKIVSITLTRRLSEDGRRLAGATVGVSPGLANGLSSGAQVTVMPATTYELEWWAAHGHKYASAGEAFAAAAAEAKAKLGATPAPPTPAPAATPAPTPSPFGGHDSACHQQFSEATSGKSNAEIQTVCSSYNPGPNGNCTTADCAGWIKTWCDSRDTR